MQMLKSQPFIFPCYAVVPHLFIAFVFPLSNIVGIGIQTLHRITDHANKFYKEKLNGDNHPLTINNFPRTLQIYDADINIAFNLEKQGILCRTSLSSKLLLQKLITDNTEDNNGFLMWNLSYCFSGIFKHNNVKTKAKIVKYYFIRLSPHNSTQWPT